MKKLLVFITVIVLVVVGAKEFSNMMKEKNEKTSFYAVITNVNKDSFEVTVVTEKTSVCIDGKKYEYTAISTDGYNEDYSGDYVLKTFRHTSYTWQDATINVDGLGKGSAIEVVFNEDNVSGNVIKDVSEIKLIENE